MARPTERKESGTTKFSDMNESQFSQETFEGLYRMQQEEVDSHAIYSAIASGIKDSNHDILYKIANDELQHAHIWKGYTGRNCEPNRLRVWCYRIMNRIFGFTFVIKMLEKGEERGQAAYAKLEQEVPEVARVRAMEAEHETMLISMLNEERLKYVGAMVLGMNDALVELTGALAGFTFAMRNTKMVALAGLITGISATLSMTASSYLSSKADEDPDALKSSAYTGVMYLVTVALLVFPYLIFTSPGAALTFMLFAVIAIVAVFNFYISVARDLSFRKRFLEMFSICIGVTVISFIIGNLVKKFLGIDLG